MAKEGDTLYNSQDNTSITLKRGSDGKLFWDQPIKLPQAAASGKMASEPPSVPYGEDVAKTLAPAAERAAVGVATGIPTMASQAAGAIGKGADYLPEGGLKSGIQSGAQTVQDTLKPITYPNVQGKIESSYNQVHPNSPLYYPQTGLGELAEAGIGGVASAVGGPLSMARALSKPLASMGGRLATGLGGAVGGELAGQASDSAGMDPMIGAGARAGGDYLGAKEGAERPRKLITPNPAISPSHLEMSRLLQQQPGDITTAGQFSGNPKFIQRDANLAPYAPTKYKNLSVTQPQADTASLLGTAGISPADAAKGASRPLIKTAKGDIGAKMEDLSSNTKMMFDPQFQSQVQDIQDNYHRIKGTSPDWNDPSPVDRRILQLYENLPSSSKPTRMGLFGGDTVNRNTGDKIPGYSKIRSDISNEAVGFSPTDPVTGGHLAQLRDALDSAMERAQAGTPYEGQWGQAFDQYGSAKTLEKATKGRPPAAGILDPNLVANSSRDPDSQIAQLARAQSVVHKPLPDPVSPRGAIPAMIGALTSYVTGGSPMEGSIAGHISGPDLMSTLTRNPVTAGVHYSDWNQNRLKNQSWQPGPGSTMDPATVARLMMLQKTEASTPDSQ